MKLRKMSLLKSFLQGASLMTVMSVSFVGCSGSSSTAPAPTPVEPVLAECSQQVADSYNQILAEVRDLKAEREKGDSADRDRSSDDVGDDMNRDAKKTIEHVSKFMNDYQNANCQVTRHGQTVDLEDNLNNIYYSLNQLSKNLSTVQNQEQARDQGMSESDAMRPLDSISFEMI
jgi:lysyl-tRNA synthetase class I